jgi:hypothetical protein
LESYNLFNATADVDTGWAHAHALAGGNLELAARIDRGVDLSAGLDLQAELGADIGRAMQAMLSAGARITGGLSLQAAMPLDLFREAGFVARLRAQVAAGAFLRARLSLQSDVLAEQVAAQLTEPWSDLARIFLSEMRVGAELIGNAQASAQLLAEAALAGNLLETGGAGAGFTCSFQYAMGYYYGAGFTFRAQYGLDSPRRLFDRLGDQLAAIVARALDQQLDRLSPPERADAQASLPLLRFTVPLVLRLLYEQGCALANAGADRQAAAWAALAQAVMREAQELAARLLFELAVSRAAQQLDSLALAELGDLDDPAYQSALEGLLQLRSALVEIERTDLAGGEWVAAASRLLAALAELAQLAPADQRAAWDELLTLAWCAAVVVERLLRWSDPARQGMEALNPQAPVGIALPARLALFIAQQLGRSDASALTVGSAVAFLVSRQAALLEELRLVLPEAAPLLDILGAIAAPQASETMLAELYQTFAILREADSALVLPRVTAVIGPAIEHLVQAALDPLARTGSDQLADLVRTVLRPALLVTARRILPEALSLGDERSATVLREQISSVLLRMCSAFLLETTRVVTEYAVTEGPPALRAFADEIRMGLGGDIADRATFVLSPAFGIPPELAPSRNDLARMLELGAETLVRWGDPAIDHRGKWFGALDQLIRLGFAIGDAEMDRLWNELATTELQQPPPSYAARLEAAALLLKDSLWDLVQFLTPRLTELFLAHVAELPRQVGAAAAQTARELVNATRAAAAWLDQQIDSLTITIDELTASIRAGLERIAAELAALALWAEQRIAAALEAVRAAGWSLVRQAAADNLLFQQLPDQLEASVLSGLRAVYDRVFATSTAPLAEPLRMFWLAAGWVREGLARGVEARSLSAEMVLEHVRQRARSMLAPALQLRVSYAIPSFSLPVIGTVELGVIDLGTLALPGSQVTALLVDLLLGDGLLRQTVERVVADQQQITQQTLQLTLLEQCRRAALTQEEAYTALGGLTTGATLALELGDPAEGHTYDRRCMLRAVLRGANRSYLSGLIGIPPRVKLLVNGVEHHFAPESWIEQGDALVYSANLVLPGADLVPLPVLPHMRILQVELGDGQLSQVRSAGQPPRYMLAPGSLMPLIPLPAGPVARAPHVAPHLGLLDPASAAWPVQDPLTGASITSLVPSQPVPAVLQRIGLFAATPLEQLGGVRWTPLGDLLGGPIADSAARETIVVRPGVNRVDIIVVDGVNPEPLIVGRTFVIQQGGQA